MAKNNRRNKIADPAPAPAPPSNRIRARHLLLAAVLVAAGLAIGYFYAKMRTPTVAVNLKNPTFAQDIAPLLYNRCAGCHHTGGTAPFPLLSYADAAKRVVQIVKVTQSRYMPPWLPEPGFGDFDGERRLSDGELAMLKIWAEHGAPQGDLARQPEPPHFDQGWQLGTPDLVVQLPRAYTLPGEGRDVYRNFAVPVPLTSDKFIKGVEFRAGSTRIHHAFMYVDETPASRRLDGKDTQPGWAGMGTLPSSAHAPSAQFTSWQPGKIPRMHEDMAWKLSPGTDLVLQLHMQPSGKPEPVQPSVAFYFTDRPGTKHPTIALLRSLDIDIPAGAKAHTVRAQYTLPIDVNILAVLPHVHYLGKDLRGVATLPDGSKTWLLWIKDWDFNWQGDYAYKQPVFLPKGTRIDMEYTFDNSAENPRNPNQPPKRVRYGLQSSDEMAELWLQMLPYNEKDSPILENDLSRVGIADSLALYAALLRENPSDGIAHMKLGKTLALIGRLPDAEAHLRSAVSFVPNSSDAHYHLAYVLEDRKKNDEAITEYRRAAELDPENYEALNALGWQLFQKGKPREAEPYLLEALRLHPNDPLIKLNLSLVQKALKK